MKRDRNIVFEDEKERILDFTEYQFIPPESGIYEGDLRYYAASLEWARFLEGHIAWLASIAAWPEAEDERYHAIQQILIFLRGVDMATEDDIAKGMYKAFNWLALQVATGQYANINLETDAEGVVTLPSGDDSDAGLPEDDPTTDFDETEASRYGAMAEIAAKLELVIDKLDTFYGNTNGTPTTPEADAQALMVQYFICDFALMEAGVTAYYAYRATAGKMFFDVNVAFVQYLYCNGYQNDALNRWLQDASAFTFVKQQVFSKLWESLGDEFFSHYFSIGAAKPSTAYLDAACVPIPPQTISSILFNVSRTTTPLKASHRMKFRWSGYATDDDGDLQDAFWVRSNLGVLTFKTPQFTHSAGSNMPSQNQVPYNSAHIYEYTIDLGALNAVGTLQILRDAIISPAPDFDYIEAFQLVLTDLGLAISQ